MKFVNNYITIVIVMCVTICACDTAELNDPCAGNEVSRRDFLPIEVGNSWVYQYNFYEPFSVGGDESRSGELVVEVLSSTCSSGIWTHTLREEYAGIYITGIYGFPGPPPPDTTMEKWSENLVINEDPDGDITLPGMFGGGIAISRYGSAEVPDSLKFGIPFDELWLKEGIGLTKRLRRQRGPGSGIIISHDLVLKQYDLGDG